MMILPEGGMIMGSAGAERLRQAMATVMAARVLPRSAVQVMDPRVHRCEG
jgi:hypothetical protein